MMVKHLQQIIHYNNRLLPPLHQHLAITLQSQTNMTVMQQQQRDNIQMISNLQHQITQLHVQMNKSIDQQLSNSLQITSYKFKKPAQFHENLKPLLPQLLDIHNRDL
eukprot:10202161-Karenia_brevis.AAC.1